MSCTTTYDEIKAKIVEQAVIGEFGCRIQDIVSISDTLVKQVVVYVLYSRLGYEKRNVGRAYSMTYLFVPTVAERIETEMVRNGVFRDKVFNVLKFIE